MELWLELCQMGARYICISLHCTSLPHIMLTPSNNPTPPHPPTHNALLDLPLSTPLFCAIVIIIVASPSICLYLSSSSFHLAPHHRCVYHAPPLSLSFSLSSSLSLFLPHTRVVSFCTERCIRTLLQCHAPTHAPTRLPSTPDPRMGFSG